MSFERGAEIYARLVGRYAPALAAAFCDAVGVKAAEDETALDVGCGPGALLGELAERLGPDQVTGVDPSEPFLALARAAVPGADVRHASAEALPFDDGAFDVVMAQLVVNFMDDPARGVSEMRRVARGTVAACVWDYQSGMTLLRTFWDAALEVDRDAPDEARTMPLCSPAALRALWEASGLRAVTTGELVVSADYADFEDLWSPFPIAPGPAGVYAASLDPDRLEALREAHFRRLGSPSGPFRLSARAWLVRGDV